MNTNQITGPFDTREELEEAIMERLELGCSGKQVADEFRVSMPFITYVKKSGALSNFGKLKRRVLYYPWDENLFPTT